MKTKTLAVIIQAEDNKVYQVLLTQDDREYVLGLLQQLHKNKIRCHEEPLEGVSLT